MSNPSEPPKVEVDLEAYVATLTAQRNQAMDTVAQQQGVIAKLQKEIADLKRPKPHLVEESPPAAE